jgi:hypothetical protein
MEAGGENPILGLPIETALSPETERVSKDRMEWNRLLQRLSVAFTHDTVCDCPRYAHRALSEINVAALESEQFTLSQTVVRKRSPPQNSLSPCSRSAGGGTPADQWAVGQSSAGNFEECVSARQWDSSSLSEGGRWSRRVPHGGDG